ncbi:MAG TPA: hypothetical protein VNW46_10425 [Gemmatimonadaceae bacterium]|jgi:hypothetical protein|nr:hypothetical protein [Gemmatimonadaceae bacterium]
MNGFRFAVVVTALLVPCVVQAQQDSLRDTVPLRGKPDSVRDTVMRATVSKPKTSHALHLIPFIAGGVTSILAHEAGHIIASYAVGAHPSFGFDHGRPVLYSGIDANMNPQKQFIFSSAGLNVQTMLDEAILDVPHHQGSTFERGILAGGIGTTVFYLTVGRDSHVGDVYWMARTSSLSKWGITAIYGGIAALQVVRIGFNGHYAHFFMSPSEPAAGPHGTFHSGLDFGVSINSVAINSAE